MVDLPHVDVCALVWRVPTRGVHYIKRYSYRPKLIIKDTINAILCTELIVVHVLIYCLLTTIFETQIMSDDEMKNKGRIRNVVFVYFTEEPRVLPSVI
jgi:hypothetical protein